jgi:predicted hydrocarbon binding protein
MEGTIRMERRKYAFSWDLLGDIRTGRPNLGERVDIKVYRLMQYTFRDVLEREYGTGEADRLFLEAGRLAGAHFLHNVLPDARNFHALVSSLQNAFTELGAGVVRVEKADPPFDEIILTVAEDVDCSGLPELDYEFCRYDEGFIQGILEGFTGRAYRVRETDCWTMGDRVCRFHAQAQAN